MGLPVACRLLSKEINILSPEFVPEFARIKIEDQEAQIAGSIGISVFPEHGTDVETLMKKADKAMYAAKKAGKNRYRVSANVSKSAPQFND